MDAFDASADGDEASEAEGEESAAPMRCATESGEELASLRRRTKFAHTTRALRGREKATKTIKTNWRDGRVWLKAIDSKSIIPVRVSGVRIPLSPPRFLSPLGKLPAGDTRRMRGPTRARQEFSSVPNGVREHGEVTELAEGARLEIVCTAKSGTEGSNPSLSAKIL